MKRKKPVALGLASFSCTIANAYYPIFTPAAVSNDSDIIKYRIYCCTLSNFSLQININLKAVLLLMPKYR